VKRLHSLLRRQIARFFGDSFVIPEGWQDFFDAVNNAYWESDTDRGMLARSIELSSQELMQANYEIRKSELRFRLLYEGSPVPYQSLNSEGCFIEVNQAFLHVLGYKRHEIIRRPFSDIMTPASISQYQRLFPRFKEYGSLRDVEYELICKDGSRINVLLDGKISYNPDGTFKQTNCIWRDITEQKKMEDELWKYREHLEDMVRERTAELKMANEQLQWEMTERKQMEKEIARLDRLNLVGEMAAGIGHEIRNPMTTVKGFLQLLSAKEECAKYNEYFSLMIDELNRANSIITEYLSLAKNRVVELKSQNLNQIVRAIFPLIEADGRVTDKQIELELSDIPDLPLDEKEIRQLIFNLARNGLEAMLPGGILLIKTFREDDRVVLAVRDLGKGIEPGVLEKIGTPFFTTKDNGTGLGLAVCYSIAASHNARIDVETGAGGTTFFVRFKAPSTEPLNYLKDYVSPGVRSI
jgi:PAS domain S-box-containing protein